jgi:hypothetical protein
MWNATSTSSLPSVHGTLLGAATPFDPWFLQYTGFLHLYSEKSSLAGVRDRHKASVVSSAASF